MSKHHPKLLADIEAFVAEAEMSEITFGRKAMKDPHFVRDIRNGRRLWPDTEQRLRKQLAKLKAEYRSTKARTGVIAEGRAA